MLICVADRSHKCCPLSPGDGDDPEFGVANLRLALLYSTSDSLIQIRYLGLNVLSPFL